MDVLVIGAGVCGLTTGICLAEAGRSVTIRTAAPPERTTSAAAGALWGLVRVGPPDRVLDWGRTGLEVMSKLAAEPGTGVRMASGREISRAPIEPHYWTELLPGLRLCDPSELPEGFTSGWHYTAPLATMPVYLGYLRARFEQAGGRLEAAPVRSLAELAGLAPAVVNCAGVYARDLVPDPEVRPVRGQVVIVANPGLEEFFINRDEEPPWITYMFPHGEEVLLGGTNDEGNWDEEPQPFIAERIVAQCAAIDPRLRGATILGHRVGLRPYRWEVRLESEPFGDGVLWHNYGHGGAGISLSWGCAAAIAAGVAGQLSSRATRRPGAIARYASWQSSVTSGRARQIARIRSARSAAISCLRSGQRAGGHQAATPGVVIVCPPLSQRCWPSRCCCAASPWPRSQPWRPCRTPGPWATARSSTTTAQRSAACR
jgi:D-amino-acid oxidase